MKNSQKKKISRSYHLLTKNVFTCRRVTAAIDVMSRYVARAWENESAMSFGRSALSREDSFSFAEQRVTSSYFHFLRIFYLPFSFNPTSFYLGWSLNA